MGQKDIAEKRLEDYNDIFADIVNALLFDGEQVVKEDELETETAKNTYTVEQKIHEIERDVAKNWKNGTIRIALLGLENQTEPDLYMPLRVLCYDGASYRVQLTKEGQKPCYPILTLVLYTGFEKHWDKPTNLVNCIDIDERLKPYINDYKINVIELAWLSDEQIMKFKSEFRNFVELLRDRRMGRDSQYSLIKLTHVHELLQLMRVMTGDESYREIQEEFAEVNKDGMNFKGVDVTMESMLAVKFKEYESRGEAKGRAEGEARGEEKKARDTALEMHKDGFSTEKIAKYVRFDIPTIKAWIKEADLGKSLI